MELLTTYKQKMWGLLFMGQPVCWDESTLICMNSNGQQLKNIRNCFTQGVVM